MRICEYSHPSHSMKVLVTLLVPAHISLKYHVITSCLKDFCQDCYSYVPITCLVISMTCR